MNPDVPEEPVLDEDGGVVRRVWGSVIVHLRRGCEDEGYDRWGPHAHVVCAGVDARETEDYHERTGVLVKMVNDREGRFASYWDTRLARHLVYELGHSAVLPDKHSVSYVGKPLIAFKVPPPPNPEKEESVPRCPHGLPLVPIGYGGAPKFDPFSGEWTIRGPDWTEYRFVDRPALEGGPLLEEIDAQGKRKQMVVTPYLDRTGLRPPPYTGPRRRKGEESAFVSRFALREAVEYATDEEDRALVERREAWDRSHPRPPRRRRE